jgi:ABC-type transport system substrate-binding protein
MQRKTPIVQSRRRFLQAAGASLAGAGALAVPFNTAWAADAKSLVIVIGSDVGSLDPTSTPTGTTTGPTATCSKACIGRTRKATSLPGSPNGPKSVRTGSLSGSGCAQGAKFHNGDPVTSDDVIFSLNRSRDPAIQNQRASLLDNIADVVRTDDRQFTVRLEGDRRETIRS